MNNNNSFEPAILIVIFFSIWISITLQVGYRIDTREQIENLSLQIDTLMRERTHLDSLYWNHIEDCAFINNSSIGIGHQGYLYDKYHREYKLK